MSDRDPRHYGRIEWAPGICAGKPRHAGTRIPVRMIVHYYDDAGMVAVLDGYPDLTETDVLAAIAFDQGRRWERIRRKRKQEREA